MTILKQTREIKFSDRKEVAELVRQAYSKLGWKWPTGLDDTPLSTSLPRNLFSIGKDNLQKKAKNDPQFQWVSRGSTNKMWDLKVIEKSIERSGKNTYGMIFVNQDLLHVNQHYEAYNDGGFYLGIINKDTMLLYAESIPYEDHNAILRKDA
jgi:hypothetical protein